MKRLHIHKRHRLWMQAWFLMAIGAAFCCFGLQNAQAVPLTDSAVTRAVERELLSDPGVAAHRIDVSTTDQVVTLSGTVDNLLSKERAARVAGTVKGVSRVLNSITVLPPLQTDQEIQESVEAALMKDPGTESFQVEVLVNDGEVTLSGEVDSFQERRLAATVAKGVDGVTALRNDLEVDPEPLRSDAELSSEIKQSLKWNVLVDHQDISIAVNDGAVALRGEVDSLAEKNQAVSEAWTHGVDSVDADQLEVVVAEETTDPEPVVEVSDAEISEAITRDLLTDPRLEDFEIDVEVEDGIATLSGTVANLKAKETAGRIARNTLGVWRVKNILLVRPGDRVSDNAISLDVKSALIRDPFVEKDEVSMYVENGKVTLSGTVDSVFEKRQAADAASRVKGVIALDNALNVEGTPAYQYDPYLDDAWSMDESTRQRLPSNSSKSDWEIASDIRDELWWSPFVDEDQVTVDVHNGVAVLSGTVDTMGERAAARENAFDGGATAVENNLKVKQGPQELLP